MSDSIALYKELQDIKRVLGEIGSKLDALQKKETLDMSKLDDQLTALATEVATVRTQDASIVTYIQGVPALVASAVQQVLGDGATPDQLAKLADAQAQIAASQQTMLDAITANTAPVTAAKKT